MRDRSFDSAHAPITARRLVWIGQIAAVLTGAAYAWYRRDLREAYDRLASYDRERLHTTVGRLEYATVGDGEPLLLVHGIAGGFDQAVTLGRPLLEAGYHCIAPSRFGYLGSTGPEDPTPRRQAEGYRELIDRLEVDRISIVAWSAGGPSALQFAMRYPDRVASLVIVSSGLTPGWPGGMTPPGSVVRRIADSNLAYWVLISTLRPALRRLLVPGSYTLTVADRRRLRETLKATLPSSPRAEGIALDLETTIPDASRHPDRYPLEKLDVPVLLIVARDDPLVDLDDIEDMHHRLPRSRLVAVDTGGHLLLGATDRATDATREFIDEHDGD